jgi:phosphopantothenoylcysteine synthetase/decarboxylase
MKQKILFQLSGSIACFKACQLISKLVQEGFEVQVSCTKNTANFIGDSTFEGLTGKPVVKDLYGQNTALGHIALAKWADLAIVCPATATTIARLANGIGEDVLGATFLSYDLKNKPYLVAPAMNHQMFHHPALTENLEKLERWGVTVLPTSFGYLACGELAEGRLLEIETIFERIVLSLNGGLLRENSYHIGRDARAN